MYIYMYIYTYDHYLMGKKERIPLSFQIDSLPQSP